MIEIAEASEPQQMAHHTVCEAGAAETVARASRAAGGPAIDLPLAVPAPKVTRVTSDNHADRCVDDWPRLRPLAELMPAITDARLRAMLAHWLAARHQKRMPAWRDIDPVELGPLLPH